MDGKKVIRSESCLRLYGQFVEAITQMGSSFIAASYVKEHPNLSQFKIRLIVIIFQMVVTIICVKLTYCVLKYLSKLLESEDDYY